MEILRLPGRDGSSSDQSCRVTNSEPHQIHLREKLLRTSDHPAIKLAACVELVRDAVGGGGRRVLYRQSLSVIPCRLASFAAAVVHPPAAQTMGFSPWYIFLLAIRRMSLGYRGRQRRSKAKKVSIGRRVGGNGGNVNDLQRHLFWRGTGLRPKKLETFESGHPCGVEHVCQSESRRLAIRAMI